MDQVQVEAIQWSKQLMVEFHRVITKLPDYVIQNVATNTKRRLKTRCTVDSSCCCVQIADIIQHGSGLFTNYLRDVCGKLDMLQKLNQWTSFEPLLVNGIPFVSGCSQRLHPTCDVKFRFYISGSIVGVESFDTDQCFVLSIPKKTGIMEKEKVVDVSQIKASSCIGPISIKINEHFLESLPCIYHAQKLIADESGNQIFNAESFHVYQRNKGSGRKSYAHARCLSCTAVSFKNSGPSRYVERDLQKVIAGQCEIIGCTERSAIGSITCHAHLRSTFSSRNKVGTVQSAAMDQEERQLMGFQGPSRDILRRLLPALSQFAGGQFNALQCANFKIELTLPFVKWGSVDLLVPSPLGVLCLEIDQSCWILRERCSRLDTKCI
ncbi:hypothetical protein MP228_002573 [Amoeboaphelidium protococcarum]|nr:hypothetical protein MP228_002573 [Amoeboaphelidium protococcarum]